MDLVPAISQGAESIPEMGNKQGRFLRPRIYSKIEMGFVSKKVLFHATGRHRDYIHIWLLRVCFKNRHE